MSQKRKSEDFRFGRIQESEICALDGGICWSLVGVCSFYCARAEEELLLRLCCGAFLLAGGNRAGEGLQPLLVGLAAGWEVVAHG